MSLGYGATAEQQWIRNILATPLKKAAWRFWLYPQPAVVLGASQKKIIEFNQDTALIPLLMRSSGGGAVLVGPWMLGLSIVLPISDKSHSESLMKTYEWLGKLLARQLHQLGVPCEALCPEQVKGSSTALAQWACYASASPWEIFHEGKKLVGLAQQRRANGILVSAGLLLSETPWRMLCHTLKQPEAEAEYLTTKTTSVQNILSYNDKNWLPTWIEAVHQELNNTLFLGSPGSVP